MIAKKNPMPLRKASSARRRNPPISVLLADGHPVLRDGLRCLLERRPGVRVVAAVGDGSAAIREAERLKPDVVVMGITMPGLNGIEATRIIAERMPGIAAIILSAHASPLIARRAMEAGARGYLCKDAATEEVLRAVHAVADGKRYIGQGLAQGILQVRKGARNSDRALENLTESERNIVKLVAEGKSNPEAGAAMGLSPRTVETYRLRLMRKLGIENLPSLVRYAIRHGIIPLE
jgi:DNA-binding NarL/FixJ family response regulator